MCEASAAFVAPQTRSPVREPGQALRRVVLHIITTLRTWQERACQRQALRRLDERMLRDIGLTRADVEIEVNKPFWKP